MTNEEQMEKKIQDATSYKNRLLQHCMDARTGGAGGYRVQDFAPKAIAAEKRLASLLHVNGKQYLPNLMSIASIYIEIGEYLDAMAYLDTIIRLANVRSLRDEAQRMRNQASDALAAAILGELVGEPQ